MAFTHFHKGWQTLVGALRLETWIIETQIYFNIVEFGVACGRRREH